MKNNKTELAYLVALILGDGTVTKYYIRISDGKIENMRFVEKIFNKLDIKTHLKQENERKFILEINSKKFIDYLKKNYGVVRGKKRRITIPKSIKSFKEIRAFMQGWFDAEGYLEKWKHPKTKIAYSRIRFGCKNKNVVLWLKTELEKLGIYVSKIWYNSKTYRFQIGQRKSVDSFLNLIGFRYPTKRPHFRDGKG